MQSIMAYLKEFNVLEAQNFWMVEVFVVVFLTLVASVVSRKIIQKMSKQLSKTKNLWDDALIHALQRPLNWLVWLFGLTYAIHIIEASSKTIIFEAVTSVRDVAVIGLIAWFLIRLIRNVENNLINQHVQEGRVDRTTIDAIAKLLRASVIITMFLVALQTLGYSISGVLAFGGIGGLAVGLASKDLLANFFGGLMVYLDRPFVIGDWIRSSDKDIEGVVENIGWRLTQIRTFDKRLLYVPNSFFNNISVENPSRMSNRRFYETIGIRYDDISKMKLIVDDVTAMLKSDDAIDQNQTMIVNFNAFSASSVDFFVYTFTKTTNWIEFHQIKQALMLKIAEIIEKHGAEIAFPTRTLHVPELVQVQEASRQLASSQ